MIWATTQHDADFAVQMQALNGKSLADPDFFEQTVKSVQAVVLNGVGAALGQRAGRPVVHHEPLAAAHLQQPVLRRAWA